MVSSSQESPEAKDHLADHVERDAKRRAAGVPASRGFWRQAARVGTLGWMIALPIVGGAFAGHLLDMHYGTGVRWALALMMLGVIAGGHALWRVLQEGTDSGGRE